MGPVASLTWAPCDPGAAMAINLRALRTPLPSESKGSRGTTGPIDPSHVLRRGGRMHLAAYYARAASITGARIARERGRSGVGRRPRSVAAGAPVVRDARRGGARRNLGARPPAAGSADAQRFVPEPCGGRWSSAPDGSGRAWHGRAAAGRPSRRAPSSMPPTPGAWSCVAAGGRPRRTLASTCTNQCLHLGSRRPSPRSRAQWMRRALGGGMRAERTARARGGGGRTPLRRLPCENAVVQSRRGRRMESRGDTQGDPPAASARNARNKVRGTPNGQFVRSLPPDGPRPRSAELPPGVRVTSWVVQFLRPRLRPGSRLDS